MLTQTNQCILESGLEPCSWHSFSNEANEGMFSYSIISISSNLCCQLARCSLMWQQEGVSPAEVQKSVLGYCSRSVVHHFSSGSLPPLAFEVWKNVICSRDGERERVFPVLPALLPMKLPSWSFHWMYFLIEVVILMIQ